MRDVAARAEVSVQTVSNLINQRFHLMGEETRVRVEQAMSDLGYHPNLAARTLRSARTETLCFLLLDEGNRFLADPMTDLIIAGIGDVARDRGYGLLIRAARPHEPDPALIRPLLENRADGAFLFMSGAPDLRKWYVGRLSDLGFPFILLEPSDDPQMLTVTADDREGARRLTAHLVAQGHKRIVFLTTKVPWPMLEQRMLGYRDALRDAGLKPIVRTGGTWTPTSGAEQADRLLSGKAAPTAIMCGNDLLALGAIRAVRDRGLSVPDDIAVTGFDDFDFAQFADPALTTVRIPGYDIGRTAGQALIGVLEGEPPAERQVVLPVALELRESA
ncbi:MAG TPA: LacI family DNA-binding transcriptional regulator [Solirubrobacteraceae bacterium]|jgi:DNA-binding LacI/PurR family transcriptional regulator|nr:LacI family DNA-binding transcriptional regulator [Solirubrobacteraceae bacterium]